MGILQLSMNIDKLIQLMQDVKAEHPSLEITDILRIFNIQAIIDLTFEITKLRGSLNG